MECSNEIPKITIGEPCVTPILRPMNIKLYTENIYLKALIAHANRIDAVQKGNEINLVIDGQIIDLTGIGRIEICD